MPSQPHCEEPMEAVGSFLKQLLFFHGKFSRIPQSQLLSKTASLVCSSHTLHFVPGCNQEGLIILLLSIYNGEPPAPYTVFHCQSTTTEQDLRLFTDRIIQHHDSHYTVLEVNKLPFHLQEVY